MVIEAVMPRMGYDMTNGTVVRWLKRVGDEVRRGDVIAEIETDKAIVEMESESEGVLRRVLVPEGASAPVGTVIALIGTADEALPDIPSSESARPAKRARRARAQATPEPRGLRAGFPPRTPGADGKVPLGSMGEAIARRTQATTSEAPLFYMTVHVDMTDAMELRRQLNAALKSGSRISLNDMVMKACAIALQKFPVFNSTFEGDHLKVHPHVNVGMAVALPDGLMVPAVLECERKSLTEIARAAKDVADRARTGTLRQAEYTGTFSVSNLGMFDVDAFTAIVVSPQVAVLAIGAVRPTPVVRRGEVVVRQMMAATLSTDHRAANGAEAAQFATEVKRLLEEPQLLT